MEKEFKIGQRVKVLYHKGTCFESATGTIIETYENFSNVRLEKNKKIQKEVEHFFSNFLIEAIEDEPKIKDEELKNAFKLIGEAIKKAFDNSIKCIQETAEEFKKQFQNGCGEDERIQEEVENWNTSVIQKNNNGKWEVDKFGLNGLFIKDKNIQFEILKKEYIKADGKARMFHNELNKKQAENETLKNRWNKLKEFVNQKLESGTTEEFFDYEEIMCEMKELENQYQDGGEDE